MVTFRKGMLRTNGDDDPYPKWGVGLGFNLNVALGLIWEERHGWVTWLAQWLN